MKKFRTRKSAFVNNTLFKSELLDDGRHIYKLITTTNVDKYEVICKYKEENERSNVKDSVINYTQISYIQNIQIETRDDQNQQIIYQIISSSRRPLLNAILRVKNGQSINIKKGSLEYKKLELILEDLKSLMSNCLVEYITLAVNVVENKYRIKKTPKCISMIQNYLDDLEDKKTLDIKR